MRCFVISRRLLHWVRLHLWSCCSWGKVESYTGLVLHTEDDHQHQECFKGLQGPRRKGTWSPTSPNTWYHPSIYYLYRLSSQGHGELEPIPADTGVLGKPWKGHMYHRTTTRDKQPSTTIQESPVNLNQPTCLFASREPGENSHSHRKSIQLCTEEPWTTGIQTRNTISCSRGGGLLSQLGGPSQ